MNVLPPPDVPGEGGERRHAEQRSRQFFEHASDAAFVHDVAGRIADVNTAACACLGYPREELLWLEVADIEMLHTGEGMRFWQEFPGWQHGKF